MYNRVSGEIFLHALDRSGRLQTPLLLGLRKPLGGTHLQLRLLMSRCLILWRITPGMRWVNTHFCERRFELCIVDLLLLYFRLREKAGHYRCMQLRIYLTCVALRLSNCSCYVLNLFRLVGPNWFQNLVNFATFRQRLLYLDVLGYIVLWRSGVSLDGRWGSKEDVDVAVHCFECLEGLVLIFLLSH